MGESIQLPGATVARSAILSGGTTVGADCVVQAGAVVTRDVAPHTLVAGVPARFVREIAAGDDV